jgi:hypothetical protein
MNEEYFESTGIMENATFIFQNLTYTYLPYSTYNFRKRLLVTFHKALSINYNTSQPTTLIAKKRYVAFELDPDFDSLKSQSSLAEYCTVVNILQYGLIARYIESNYINVSGTIVLTATLLSNEVCRADKM